MLKLLVLLFSIQFAMLNFSNASYKHLVQTDLNFLNGEGRASSGSVDRVSRFSLNLNYWRQFIPNSYLIGEVSYFNFGSKNGLAGPSEDEFSLGFGYGYNFNSKPDSALEYGPSILFKYFNEIDDKSESYSFLPSLYVRYFLNQSNAFLAFNLSYFMNFFDDMDEIDASGVTTSLNIGLAF